MPIRSFSKLVQVFALVVLVAPLAQAQAPDPAAGTWELNLAKSKFAGPAPKSQTRTIEVIGDRLKFTAKGVDAEGKPTLIQFEAPLDGKEVPITGNAAWDTISVKRIDRLTVESYQKKAGKIVARNRRVVSADGKTMTLTTEFTNDKGVASTDVLVFDKR